MEKSAPPDGNSCTRDALALSAQGLGRTGPIATPESILFQTFFKSVGPRTYAVQVKQAGNGNHALVLIEGKRDAQTNEVKKHRLYLWSEDFAAFFGMLQETVKFIRENPVPEEVWKKRERFWSRQGKEITCERPGGRR